MAWHRFECWINTLDDEPDYTAIDAGLREQILGVDGIWMIDMTTLTKSTDQNHKE